MAGCAPGEALVSGSVRECIELHEAWCATHCVLFLQRRVSLRATAWHGMYCGVVTIPFVYADETLKMLDANPQHVSDVCEPYPLPYSASLLCFAHMLDIQVEALIAYVSQNGDLMTGCTSFLGTALFLMVSFRINRAISRWWGGRTLFSELLGNARALVHTGLVYHNAKPEGVTS